MTTVTAAARVRTSTPTTYRLSFARSLHSEWIKLATLRSTWWSIAFVGVMTVGISLLIASSVGGDEFTGIQAVTMPTQFTMLLAGILGVIAVTGEYSTGMIRSTLAADPIRGSVLAAKSAVVAALMFVASLAISLIAAVVVTPILGSGGAGIDWSSFDATFRPLLGAAFSMSVFALIGVAFGFLLRSGAGAIAATVGLLFVLPIVVNIFPAEPAWQWIHDLSSYLPMFASSSLTATAEGAALSAPVAFLALGGWVAAGMASSWAVLRMRDA
ncbi:ABC transporter permease subunit [Microbacterium sp. RD1]|uniref:ABC transporter permease subunit n=1 Tax=Microbacterium sp. RD1 TaxID=3457313 RepID=UPI003FA59A02